MCEMRAIEPPTRVMMTVNTDDLSPWPHFGTAEDVAKLAMYLASDDAEMVTGSMQVLDGGYTAG
jgi:enoyl-[acyl-carrier-protein] reductase (NADH)